MPNAREISAIYRARQAGLGAGLKRGMRKGLIEVDRESSKLLSGPGSAKPGAYPVPIRIGNLRRGGGMRLLSDTSGVVFNRANYARAVHDGFRAWGNSRAPHYAGRPFLDDAVAKADPSQYVFAELRAVILK